MKLWNLLVKMQLISIHYNMKPNRIEQLLEFYKDEPNDPFTIYALATEYRKFDKNKALQFYELLLKDHINYVGTYYHAASLYDELKMEKEAKTTYQKGMKIARQENNMHAFSELQGAFNKFMGLDYEDEV